MARANRHYIPGQVWHITHRCHKQEFLLKFAKDRRRWHYWLFEAKKRFGLRILNYVITSNHIHLLVIDSGPDVISKSLQLVAGRIAQEFNNRKERKGAFWEDRYHATAVEQNEHLIRCLTYIDLNMVRAGVVSHPAEWESSGYNEIQNPPERYGVIDRMGLQHLCGISDSGQFAEQHRQWVNDAIHNCRNLRESCWTESIAVGSSDFIEETMFKLGSKARGRRIEEQEGERFVLREAPVPYGADYHSQKGLLSLENSYYWNTSILVPMS